MRISSMNTTTKLSRNLWSILFIVSIKMVGAFVSPKEITLYSQFPYMVENIVFLISCSRMKLIIPRLEINLGEHLSSI
jgi:hypothetical protein